jgi:uncharacterized OB-fold protein
MIEALVGVSLPLRDALNAPYWEALDDGRLMFQRCFACANAWLPPRHECPRCLHDAWAWELASGEARLVSWVVYHTAFHPAFKDRLPYTVAIVELVEGPRLISNIVDIDDPEKLAIDQVLLLTIEREGGMAIPRFRPRVF